MEKMAFYDYSLLRKEIRKAYGTHSDFAKQIRMSRVSLSEKLNNKREWTQFEITRSAKALGLDLCDIPALFFTLKVQKTEQSEEKQSAAAGNG